MERKGCGKTERPIPVFLWRIEKTHEKSVTIVSRSPRQDMNPGYSEVGVVRHPV